MLSYVDEKLRFVALAIPNNMLYNIRLPVLIYVGYRLYHRLFFNQFLKICVFGILANIILVPIASIICQHLIRLITLEYLSYLETVMFVTVSLFTDPITILKLPPNKNFFLFLGIFTLGNSTLLDIFCPVVKLASRDYKDILFNDCSILFAADVLDIILGVMLGCLVGILTSLMSILTRKSQGATLLPEHHGRDAGQLLHGGLPHPSANFLAFRNVTSSTTWTSTPSGQSRMD